MSIAGAKHAAISSASSHRSPGRPKHSTTIPPEQIEHKCRAAYLALQADAGYAPTRMEVAEQLDVSDRTLRRWFATYHVTWPPRPPTSPTP